MDDTILHRDKMAVIGIHILLGRPTEIAVVNDIILAILRSKSTGVQEVTIRILVTNTETKVTQDKVLGIAQINLIMRNNDTHSRCCLSGDRIVLAADTQVFDKAYLTGHGNTHRDGFVRILLQRPAKRTYGSTVGIVLEVRDINHLTSATTGGIFTESFGTREGDDSVRQQSGRSDY